MKRATSRPTTPRIWRRFAARDGRRLEQRMRRGDTPCCPCCGELLEARPGTRFASHIPLDATGYDLDCRDCRRFWCMVRHTARSLRLVRMRRLAAAVRAVDAGSARTDEPSAVAATSAAA